MGSLFSCSYVDTWVTTVYSPVIANIATPRTARCKLWPDKQGRPHGESNRSLSSLVVAWV